MRALDTASFTLEHEGEPSEQLFFGAQLQLMEGQVDMPDRFKVRVEAISIFPRSFIKINMVGVGDQVFITDFINREKWNQIPVQALPFNFANLGHALSDMSQSLQGPTFNGTEVVDGVPSWRIKGTVSSESLAVIAPGVDLGRQVGLELWIDLDQGLLRKVRIEGQIYSKDQPDVVRVLTIYSFDEPVEISLPQTQ